MKSTVRRLMIVVAITAFLVWSTSVTLRWIEYRRLAVKHEQICDVLASEMDELASQVQQSRPKDLPEDSSLAAQIRERRSALSIERKLAMNYRQAISRPWLGVPDVGH